MTDVLDRADVLYQAPAVGQVAGLVSAIRTGAVGEAIQQCAEFGQLAYGYACGDPVEVACAAGLSWLVGVIQPLEDELAKVTGNADRLREDAECWRSIATGMTELGTDVRVLPDRELAGWRGHAGGSAAGRLREFADGLVGVAGEVHDLRSVLLASLGMFEAARELVLDVIATFVEWAILTWIVAQATAAASCGASVTFAIARLDAEVALATERVSSISIRVESALLRIGQAFGDLLNRVATRLPGAATDLVGHPAAELAGRVPEMAAAVVGHEAAGLLDSATAGLVAYGHLPQPALLPWQLDPDRPLTRMR